MTYRKKRLLLIQGALLFAALLLFYIFYYEGKKNQVAIETDSVVLEKATKEEVSNYFEDVQYKGIDSNGNRYLLKSEVASFNDESPELINMEGMTAIFYFKDGKVLKVSGEKGKYNNKNNDMSFRNNVKVTQADNKIFADNLDYFSIKKLIKVYGNIRGESLDGNFTADILDLDIERQSVDFLMYNNEQVKMNLKK